MRPALLILGALALTAGLALATHRGGAEPAAGTADPWSGTYLKYDRYDTHRQGQFGEAQQITITRDGDGYRLSKPYEGRKFTEVRKGVLSDGKGGLGKLYLGTAEFADGKRVRILRAEFCYDWFILYAQEESPPREDLPKGK